MTYFAPASVTAFFSPHYTQNPLETGSVGVGITLERGVRANLIPEPGKVKVNGKDFGFRTVEMLFERLSFKGGLDLEADIPVGCGFGFSGASCLAAAFEINEKNGIGLGTLELADIAHECEVLSSTGLGDVVCQVQGGVVLRKKAGSPSKALVERFHFDARLSFLVLGPISTKEVLRDEEIVDRIKKFGSEAVKKFSSNPSLHNLFKLSKDFATKTGLLDDEIAEIIRDIEKMGYQSSMVMLGKAVFSTCPVDLLREYGTSFSSEISGLGVRKLG